jgi:hypothetical protein
MHNTDQHRRTPIRNSLAVAILLLASSPLFAQTPAAIPIPAQLTTAQTAFVANAGGPDNYLSRTAYMSFYQALTSWRRFQLTAAPANAELALELTTAQRGGTTLTSHLTVLELNIRDIKTQSLLWSFTEPVNSAATPMASDLAASAAKLVADFNALLSGPLVSEPAPKKTRFSDEKK